MTRTVVSLSAMILSIVLLVSGNAFLSTLLGIRLSLEDIDARTIGWVLVCYSIGFVLGTLYVPRVIARVGHIRTFAVFAAAAAIAALLYPMFINTLFWAALRALSGFAVAGVLLVIESWFSSRATSENRGALFAVYQMVFFTAVAGGQLIINLGDPASFRLFTVAAILLAVALIPLSLTRMEAPPVEVTERMSFFDLLRESTSGVGGSLICGVLIGAFYALGPVYATMIGLDLRGTSAFMAVAIIAAMALAWPIGKICDRYDRRRVLVLVSLLAAIAATVAASVGISNSLVLVVAVGVFTGLSASLYPIAVAITHDWISHNRIVAASASLLLSFGIGSIIGPVVLAELMGLTGPQGLFLGSAGFLILLALLINYQIRTTRDIPVEEQEHYINATPQTLSTMLEIDPRNEDFHAAFEAATGDTSPDHTPSDPENATHQ